MREFRRTIEIDAPPSRVWEIMADVERWREWTPTIEWLKVLSTGPVGLGSQVRIKQPKLPAGNWTVTRWEPDAGFTWTSRASGVTVVGDHRIVPTAAGSMVELNLTFDGILSPLVAKLGGKLTREYVRLEAEGLKRRSEVG